MLSSRWLGREERADLSQVLTGMETKDDLHGSSASHYHLYFQSRGLPILLLPPECKDISDSGHGVVHHPRRISAKDGFFEIFVLI